MRKSVFLKHIEQLEEKDLRDELMTLYDKVQGVSKYYAMELGSDKDREKYFAGIKKQIKSKYATKSMRKPRRPRIQKINKILSEVAKTVLFDYEMIDIYLFNAEEAVNFMIIYNFFSTPVFNSILNSYVKALDLIASNRMEERYEASCQSILLLARIDRALYTNMKSHFDKIYG
ncbi:MAG: hypothetical protein HKN09_07910 [Saprospiraceae bacterium]|nr:hypothetical protein [Saprospiraceae bacterium]